MFGRDAAERARQERGLDPGFGERGFTGGQSRAPGDSQAGVVAEQAPYMDPAPAMFQEYVSTMQPSIEAAQAPFRFTQRLADAAPLSMLSQGIGSIGRTLFNPDAARAQVLALGSLPQTTVDTETGGLSVDLGKGTIDMNEIGNFTFSGMGYNSLQEMADAVGSGVMTALGKKAQLAVDDRLAQRGDGTPLSTPILPQTQALEQAQAPVVEDPSFRLQRGGNYFTQMFGIDPKYLNYGLLPSELLSGQAPR